MPNHPRIECSNLTNFTTVRSAERRIWFTCNEALEEAVLGHLAQCMDRYSVKLYAFALEGTHKHELADYPECNRASFFRDFNSAVSRAVKRFQRYFTGGQLWGKRYSNEFVPLEGNIEDKFFYIVLQPVQDALVESIDEYPGYNCFYDAVKGVEREFPVVNWAKYNSDKRWKKNIDIEEYTTYYTLKYSRLPGYEDMSQEEYEKVMTEKLEERTKDLVREMKKKGIKFMGKKKLLATRPGTKAKGEGKYSTGSYSNNQKDTNSTNKTSSTNDTSNRWNYRPRFICSCPETHARYLEWYFGMLEAFYEASRAYLTGEFEGDEPPEFPPGMYKPPSFTKHYELTHHDLVH